MGFFDTLFSPFNNDNAQKAAADQTAGINAGLTGATNYINTGNQALNTNYNAALQPFLTNIKTGQQGTTAYGNATGANGPQGNAAATQAFWNNPGTSAALRMGDNAIIAADQANGTGNSGNEAIDLANYNQGVTSQGWNNYVSSLAPYLNFNTQNALGGGAVSTGLGNALNQNQQNLANMYYGAQTSIGNANANAQLANNNAGANMWNLIGNAGGAVLGALPFL